MLIVNARKARVVFSELLSEAEHGAVVSITRRGREVARLVPPDSKLIPPESSESAENGRFPDLTHFRSTITVQGKGKPTSEQVADMRDEERY